MESAKGFMYVYKAPNICFVTWSWLSFTGRRQRQENGMEAWVPASREHTAQVQREKERLCFKTRWRRGPNPRGVRSCLLTLYYMQRHDHALWPPLFLLFLSLSLTHTQEGTHKHTHTHNKGCIDTERQKLRLEPTSVHSTAGWLNINFAQTSHAVLLEHKMPFRGSGDFSEHCCNQNSHYRPELSPVPVFN